MSNQSTGVLERLFHLSENNTTVKRECLAGLTTFVSMAYILFVNPIILGDAGMDAGAVFTATALSAIMGCLLMGFLANYPIAIAPGLGDNAFFTYSVVLAHPTAREHHLHGTEPRPNVRHWRQQHDIHLV